MKRLDKPIIELAKAGETSPKAILAAMELKYWNSDFEGGIDKPRRDMHTTYKKFLGKKKYDPRSSYRTRD